MTDLIFSQLVQSALNHDFSGWDFSWLNGRWLENDPPWDYRQIVQENLPQATALLDMGTGGGEFLASLQNRPPITYATESYPPNIPIAQGRLSPLGISVIPLADDQALPLPSDFFELVINRHESYWMPEVFRVLKPGGIFLTQQVGSQDCIQLNRILEAPLPVDNEDWELKQEINNIREAGFHILRAEEAYPETLFYDIGAIVFF